MLAAPPQAYATVPEWNREAIDVSIFFFNFFQLEHAKSAAQGVSVVKQMDIYQNEVEMEQALKPKLYYYPETDKPTAIFDFEELEN